MIDCYEIKVQKPKNVHKQNNLYSQYKGGHTAKYFIGAAPHGFISYLSKGAGGRTGDPQITNKSGFLNQEFSAEDVVLADKGFGKVVVNEGIVLIPPKKKSGEQFSPEDLALTQKIASKRIHIERVIGRLRVFRILTNRVPLSMMPYLDKVNMLCAALVNFQLPIFAASEQVSELHQQQVNEFLELVPGNVEDNDELHEFIGDLKIQGHEEL